MKAIWVNTWITAREKNGGMIYLSTPSDMTEAGHLAQANEIRLTREEIARLAKEFPVADHE